MTYDDAMSTATAHDESSTVATQPHGSDRQANGKKDREPRWLSSSEQATWLTLVALMTRVPTALDADLQATSGLSLFEYVVLSRLSEADDRTMRMSELAARVNSSPSRLSHGIARLQRRGWVCRSPLPADGRQIMAALTPAGFEKVEVSAPHHVDFVRKLVIDVLTPAQLQDLHAAARLIVDSVDTALAPWPCREPAQNTEDPESSGCSEGLAPAGCSQAPESSTAPAGCISDDGLTTAQRA